MGQFEPKCGTQLIVGFGFQWMESCLTPVLFILSFYLYTCLPFVVFINTLPGFKYSIKFFNKGNFIADFVLGLVCSFGVFVTKKFFSC